MPSSHLILCCPLRHLPPIPPSIRVFSNESTLHMRWPKYWSFSFNISPSNEHPGLISFKIDWLDFLAVQRTLRSLLQHHSSKASILWCSAFFIVQLSHPYMTTGKTIALIWSRANVIIKETKCIINVMHLNHIKSFPHSASLWKNFLSRNWSLVPKRLWTNGLGHSASRKENTDLKIIHHSYSHSTGED